MWIFVLFLQPFRPTLGFDPLGMVKALSAASSYGVRRAKTSSLGRGLVLNLGADGNDGNTQKSDMVEAFKLGSRKFDVQEMILMRAIQTQMYYYIELRNEPLAQWMSKHRGYDHLDAGSKWHCCLGMRDSVETYLTELIKSPNDVIEVQYGLGVGWKDPSTVIPIEPAEQSLMPWSAAAASRRKNPYLKVKPKAESIVSFFPTFSLLFSFCFCTAPEQTISKDYGVRSYEETVEPKKVCATLLTVCASLAREASQDLALLAAFDDEAARARRAAARRLYGRDVLDGNDGFEKDFFRF